MIPNLFSNFISFLFNFKILLIKPKTLTTCRMYNLKYQITTEELQRASRWVPVCTGLRKPHKVKENQSFSMFSDIFWPLSLGGGGIPEIRRKIHHFVFSYDPSLSDHQPHEKRTETFDSASTSNRSIGDSLGLTPTHQSPLYQQPGITLMSPPPQGSNLRRVLTGVSPYNPYTLTVSQIN